MFRITFSAETQEDNGDTIQESGMSLNFPVQPTWSELTDKFLDFLRAQGYVFDFNAELTVVTPECFKESDSEDMEPTPWEDEREAIQKIEDKLRKSGGKGKKKK